MSQIYASDLNLNFLITNDILLSSSQIRKDWLKRVGSPKSRIDGADFKTAKAISSFSYGDFQIIK